jgi:hypothetical protein
MCKFPIEQPPINIHQGINLLQTEAEKKKHFLNSLPQPQNYRLRDKCLLIVNV